LFFIHFPWTCQQAHYLHYFLLKCKNFIMQALFLSDQLMDPKERAENCGIGGGIRPV
jgi:hypothetical protein